MNLISKFGYSLFFFNEKKIEKTLNWFFRGKKL
jgi:hypothetical protein